MPRQSSGFALYVCNNFFKDGDGDVNTFFLTSTKTLGHFERHQQRHRYVLRDVDCEVTTLLEMLTTT